MKAVKKLALLGMAVLATCAVTAVVPCASLADDFGVLPDGSKVNLSERCPVCGMTVGADLGATVSYSYRDNKPVGFSGVAAAVFKDGRVVGFEGARCLFIYNAVPKKFGIEVENIAHRFVTDFRSGKFMDVANAFLVLGSPVKGPMGFELIPFPSMEEAEKFKSEFGGKRIVQLGTVEFRDVERERRAIRPQPAPETPK
jgi:nitrous oxide reductase accessory protein NosL